jgi:hypothetical protein
MGPYGNVRRGLLGRAFPGFQLQVLKFAAHDVVACDGGEIAFQTEGLQDSGIDPERYRGITPLDAVQSLAGDPGTLGYRFGRIEPPQTSSSDVFSDLSQ